MVGSGLRGASGASCLRSLAGLLWLVGLFSCPVAVDILAGGSLGLDPTSFFSGGETAIFAGFVSVFWGGIV